MMTCSTSAVAVCCSNASRVSVYSRAFSIAITAWAAKFCNNADGQEGRKLRMHFCLTCGTTVFWEADLRPDHVGVAVGAFHDANFPRPTRSVWEESKHGWVAFADDVAHFPTVRPT